MIVSLSETPFFHADFSKPASFLAKYGRKPVVTEEDGLKDGVSLDSPLVCELNTHPLPVLQLRW